jgi:hypothetical protein
MSAISFIKGCNIEKTYEYLFWMTKLGEKAVLTSLRTEVGILPEAAATWGETSVLGFFFGARGLG